MSLDRELPLALAARRLREAPFPTARLRREDRDDTLKVTLTDPAQAGAAILAWAVRGCARWLADGLGAPAAVMQAHRRLPPRARAPDRLRGRLLHPRAGRLRDEYEAWARREGLTRLLQGRAWGDALRALGCSQRRRTGGDRR